MKAKFEVGAEIDFLTKGELREQLDAWFTEVTRGVRFRQFSAEATVAGGVWSALPNVGRNLLGPRAGFLWSVTGIAVSGNGFNPAADTYSVFFDEASPTKLVRSGLTRDSTWDVGSLVIDGASGLALSGVGTAGGTEIWVSGRAVEVPVQLAWQLL